MNEIWIKNKASELKKTQDELYSGKISGRDYQDKIRLIKDEVRLKEGINGILLLNNYYKDLMEDAYANN